MKLTHITHNQRKDKMNKTRIANLNKKIRAIGHDLSLAEMRGMRGGNYFARKLAHNLLLGQLYDLEKRHW
jgi:hypothetical protein